MQDTTTKDAKKNNAMRKPNAITQKLRTDWTQRKGRDPFQVHYQNQDWKQKPKSKL